MNKDLTESLEQLNGSVKNYVQVKLDLIKLTIIEKAATVISVIYVLSVVLFFFLLIIVVGVAAFAVWYGQTFNDYVSGLLIAGGGLILLMVILVVVGKKLLSNTIIRAFAGKMFSDKEK
jgi:hypothetical protein